MTHFPSNPDTGVPATPARTWTEVGAPTVDALGRAEIEQAITELVWRPFTSAAVAQLNFLDKTALKTLIAEFELPIVTRVAEGIVLGSRTSSDDSATLLGVGCRYRNGTAIIYAVDTGTTVIVVADDFTPTGSWPEAG